MDLSREEKKASGIARYLKEETKRHSILRYLLALSILVFYGFYSIYKFGVQDGFVVTVLTWSFFVFCTPIADGGFLIDFPFRLLTHLRMIYSEVMVWVLATGINVYYLLSSPEIYEKTSLLRILKLILPKPYPYWIVIFVSIVGTFLSIYFGDELVDVAEHKDRVKYKKHIMKYRTVVIIFVIVGSIVLYGYLAKGLGVSIPTN